MNKQSEEKYFNNKLLVVDREKKIMICDNGILKWVLFKQFLIKVLVDNHERKNTIMQLFKS